MYVCWDYAAPNTTARASCPWYLPWHQHGEALSGLTMSGTTALQLAAQPPASVPCPSRSPPSSARPSVSVCLLERGAGGVVFFSFFFSIFCFLPLGLPGFTGYVASGSLFNSCLLFPIYKMELIIVPLSRACMNMDHVRHTRACDIVQSVSSSLCL